MIDPNFFDHVNVLLLDHPASVTRFCSTAQHNQAVGGAPNSGHLCRYGPNKDAAVAVDLIFDSVEELTRAAKTAYAQGFQGIEVDFTNNHLHLDEVPRVWRVVKLSSGREMPLDQYMTVNL